MTNVSVPNLIGLALGAGGETDSLRLVLSGVLTVFVLLCCLQAWRRRGAITASGWAGVALLVTLSWVLPWYVLWVLPLAALSSSHQAADRRARAGRLSDHRLGSRLGDPVERDRLSPREDISGQAARPLRQGAPELS